MRLATLPVCVFLVLCGTALSASAQQQLKLPSGVVVSVANLEEPEREDGRKAIKAFLMVNQVGQYTGEQRSIISDEFFELYFGPYAEHKQYTVAEIDIGNARQFDESGTGMFMTVQSFTYQREKNGVWNPGHDSLVDNEPVKKGRKVTLPSGAVVHVEFEGAAYVNLLQGQAWVGAFWSDAPLADASQVYPRAREYWESVKTAVPSEIQVGNVAAYDTPKLGYFHFRDALVITMSRTTDGSWPDLPETLEDAQKGQERIQASFREERIKTIWPDK